MAALAINSMNPDPAQKSVKGPWIMSCAYCSWTSLEIGWQFDKLINIHQQISKLRMSGEQRATITSKTDGGKASSDASTASSSDDEPDTVFAALSSFYNLQLSATNPSDPLLTPSGGFNYSSPSNLARIMTLYTGRSFYKKDQGKGSTMREAADATEGLREIDTTRDSMMIQKLKSQGWTGTASVSQQSDQQQHPPRFTEYLKPLRALLRTKRSKRCRDCRHILVKPEPKVQSTRFRIRLVARNFIPAFALKPLHPSPATGLPMIDLDALPPSRACQFLLTITNPLFDPIKVTLATPTHTPGKYSHKVTILCPEFDVGHNVDQYDELLDNSSNRRMSKSLNPYRTEYAGGEGGRIAEAGKVWDKDKNTTTVVVEIVCAPIVLKQGDVAEDEDIVEIPVFVRLDWEAEVERDDGNGKTRERKEKRELAYWTVIGLGREARHIDSNA